MQNKIEIFNNQVIINYNLAYPKSREVLLKSHTFAKFVQYFIEYQESDNANMYAYLTKNGELNSKEASYYFCHFLRLLSIFTCEELKDEYYLSNKDATLSVIEEMYRNWRSLQRFGYMKSDNSTDFGINTLVAFDSA